MGRKKREVDESVTQEVLYVADMAKLLGRSVSSIENALKAKSDWLPPHFKSGAYNCWRRSTVLRFLEEQEQRALNPVKKKRGRPRKTPEII